MYQVRLLCDYCSSITFEAHVQSPAGVEADPDSGILGLTKSLGSKMSAGLTRYTQRVGRPVQYTGTHQPHTQRARVCVCRCMCTVCV